MHPTVESIWVIIPYLNCVRIRIWSAGQRAESSATLTLAPARQVSAKCLDVELRSLGEELLILKRGVITLEPESIEKARARSAIVFNENRVGRIYCRSPTQTHRLAMFLVVCIERQDEWYVDGYIPQET